jgi:hypothetical protein
VVEVLNLRAGQFQGPFVAGEGFTAGSFQEGIEKPA